MRRSVLIALLAISIVVTMPVLASTFVHMSTKQLIAEADALVQGRVVELSSFWTDSGRLIVTDVTIAVEETLLGEAPATVTVRTFGGEVGEMKVEAHGFPRFERGERVLVYLTTNPDDGTVRVLGYQEGQFRVVTRLDGVTLAVPMVDEGARFLSADGKAAPVARSLEISAFRASVAKIAADVRRDSK